MSHMSRALTDEEMAVLFNQGKPICGGIMTDAPCAHAFNYKGVCEYCGLVDSSGRDSGTAVAWTETTRKTLDQWVADDGYPVRAVYPALSAAIRAALAEIVRMQGVVVNIQAERDAAEAELARIEERLTNELTEIAKPKRTPVCECLGYEQVKGPYPSGICWECGRWYPPKRAEVV